MIIAFVKRSRIWSNRSLWP